MAIIPARGGSKGLPRKNIKPLRDVPLLAYSIAAATQAQTVERVIVSTDDEEIAQIAREWGAEVPFLRPAHLASDTALDLGVFQHALDWLAEHEGYTPEFVVQLRPTTPLRPPDCVDGAVRLLQTHPDADSVRGVVPSRQSPYKMWRIPQPDAPMQPLLTDEFEEPYNMPRQALPQIYWQTGHVDVIRAATLRADSMTGARVYPYVLDARYTLDIDSPLDWERAEWMLDRLALDYVRP